MLNKIMLFNLKRLELRQRAWLELDLSRILIFRFFAWQNGLIYPAQSGIKFLLKCIQIFKNKKKHHL